MKKNIVIVYDQAYISGGAAQIAIGSAIALKRKGYRVIFFAAIGDVCDELKLNGIETICLNQEHIAFTKNLKVLLKGLWNSDSMKELEKVLSDLNSAETVVHIHGWTKSLSSSIFLATYKKGFKTFVTLHEYFTICPNGGIFNYKKNEICKIKPCSLSCYLCNCDKRNYNQKMYRNVRQIIQNHILRKTKPNVIYITEFSRNLLERNHFKPSSVHMVTNFVNIDHKTRVDVGKNNGYIYLGRVSAEKGIDIFCEACKVAGVKGVVIGDGPQREEYETKYPNIDFIGWKSMTDMEEYLLKARSLIIASKWYETMGLTAIELQSYGIPCIVPRECAASEYIKDGVTGLLYKIGSTDDLVRCIKILEDSEMAERLGENNYNSLNRERFSLDCHTQELEKVYFGVQLYPYGGEDYEDKKRYEELV